MVGGPKNGWPPICHPSRWTSSMSTQTTSRKASDPSKATITSVSLAARSCFCLSVKAPSASVTVTSGMTCSSAGEVIPVPWGAGGSGLGVLLDEGQGDVGDFPPAVVDGQGVPAAGDLDDLGDVGVALLPLVGGVSDSPRDGVVHLAVDDEQRPAAGVLGVDFRLGPRIEVGGGSLEQRDT